MRLTDKRMEMVGVVEQETREIVVDRAHSNTAMPVNKKGTQQLIFAMSEISKAQRICAMPVNRAQDMCPMPNRAHRKTAMPRSKAQSSSAMPKDLSYKNKGREGETNTQRSCEVKQGGKKPGEERQKHLGPVKRKEKQKQMRKHMGRKGNKREKLISFGKQFCSTFSTRTTKRGQGAGPFMCASDRSWSTVSLRGRNCQWCEEKKRQNFARRQLQDCCDPLNALQKAGGKGPWKAGSQKLSDNEVRRGDKACQNPTFSLSAGGRRGGRNLNALVTDMHGTTSGTSSLGGRHRSQPILTSLTKMQITIRN